MVETLGEAWTFGWRIHLHCAQGKRMGMKAIRACTWRHEADLMTLLATRGPNFPLARLESRMMCPRCHSHCVLVIFEPPAGGQRAAGRIV